jgi:hypothetical protein
VEEAKARYKKAIFKMVDLSGALWKIHPHATT